MHRRRAILSGLPRASISRHKNAASSATATSWMTGPRYFRAYLTRERVFLIVGMCSMTFKSSPYWYLLPQPQAMEMHPITRSSFGETCASLLKPWMQRLSRNWCRIVSIPYWDWEIRITATLERIQIRLIRRWLRWVRMYSTQSVSLMKSKGNFIARWSVGFHEWCG